MYIYILYLPRRGWLLVPRYWKIGISGNLPERLANIRAQSERQKARLLLSLWLPSAAVARRWERQLHDYYRPFQSPFLQGSGRTEWFKLRLPLWAILRLGAVKLALWLFVLGLLCALLAFCYQSNLFTL